jgi:hypothetical protein
VSKSLERDFKIITIMSQSKHFTTKLSFKNTPAEVYNAINNVRGWWQGEITGSTDQLNDEFGYQMETFHFSKQKVTELVPNEKIVWLVTESNLSFTEKKDEWTGTKIVFEIKPTGDKTELHFTHIGLVPEFECYNDCKGGWTALIQKSLTSLLKTGKGAKVF